MAVLGLKSYILDNNWKSVVLLAGFPVLLTGAAYGVQLVLMGLGYLPSTSTLDGDFALSFRMLAAGAPLAFLVAGIWFAIAYWGEGSIIAAATGAQPVTRQDEPALYNLLENLCISRGMPTPSIRIVEDEALNAYASGLNPKQQCVTVTRGLLKALQPEELEAVLGHELTHIINRDTRLMVICAVFAGIISLIAQSLYRALLYGGGRRRDDRKGNAGFILFAVGAVLIVVGYGLSVVIRFALSRKREYMADAGSVELTKNPDAMIRALAKIKDHAELDAPGQVTPLFIEHRGRGLAGLFDSHPPIDDRIAALVKYAGGRVEAQEPPTTGVPVTE
jgi:heat shock protein HtpX